ncbi:FadR/GntR family transcriptional regulator [Antarcticirhabdus aurantiaca]|uniref:GntR family transcriptional regulator n=1 Tax=Antarcticirhabdus aurantiaca TaxID=2606717 RepID=A0ACD4NJ56_9HYPH|nr:GntR family transcriptional regulator [Jeongeuplla avenae]
MAPTSHMREAIEVMEAFGICPATVREVMRHLQALGVVETRRGSGSFLLKPVSAETIHLPLSIEPGPGSRSPLHALDVCRALEVEAAIMAARRTADADIKRHGRLLIALEQTHRKMEASAPENSETYLPLRSPAARRRLPIAFGARPALAKASRH